MVDLKRAICCGLLLVSVANTAVMASDSVEGCFVRNYDAAHLATHVNQLVTNTRLVVRRSETNSAYSYNFILEFMMRGRTKPLRTEGSCRKEGKSFNCSVECDGGGVNVVPFSTHAMMYLDSIRMVDCDTGSENPGKYVSVSGGLDDREFRINRVNDNMCGDLHFF